MPTISFVHIPATCNCDKDFSKATKNSSLTDKATNSSHFGGLAVIISNLVTDSCGSCTDYGETTVKSSDRSKDSALEYPVSRASYGKTDGYSTFIPVIEIPGVVILTRKTETPGALSQVATNSILEAWPLFVLTIMTALLAGIIIWVLVSRFILLSSVVTRETRGSKKSGISLPAPVFISRPVMRGYTFQV